MKKHHKVSTIRVCVWVWEGKHFKGMGNTIRGGNHKGKGNTTRGEHCKGVVGGGGNSLGEGNTIRGNAIRGNTIQGMVDWDEYYKGIIVTA